MQRSLRKINGRMRAGVSGSLLKGGNGGRDLRNFGCRLDQLCNDGALVMDDLDMGDERLDMLPQHFIFTRPDTVREEFTDWIESYQHASRESCRHIAQRIRINCSLLRSHNLFLFLGSQIIYFDNRPFCGHIVITSTSIGGENDEFNQNRKFTGYPYSKGGN